MKKYLFFVAIFFLSGISHAQITNGKVEISGSFSLGSVSSSHKSNDFSIETEGRQYFNTSIKAGYHFLNGFEFEPEIYAYLLEKIKPSILISSNIAYNYHVKETSIYPFILIGYGIGNSLPFLLTNNSYIRTSDEFDVGCINVGVGLKYYFTNHVGLRVEYRYQSYTDKNEEYWDNYVNNSEYKIKLNSFLFGLSVIL